MLVSLVGGELVFDGSAAYESLGVGESMTQSFTYTIDDGSGGVAAANVDVTFCGLYETFEELEQSLPIGEICFQIVDNNLPSGSSDEAYSVLITNADGDARFDNVTFTATYCVGAYEFILAEDPVTGLPNAPLLKGTLSLIDDDTAFGSSQAGETLADANPEIDQDELDNMINYILNTDFASQGYSDSEIQGAIWGITDNIVFVPNGGGSTTDAQEILHDAIANGQEFEVGEGDIVGVFIDPTDATEADGHSQPFMVGMLWDECIC